MQEKTNKCSFLVKIHFMQNHSTFENLTISLNNDLLNYWDQLARIHKFFHDPDRSNILVFEIPLAYQNSFVTPIETALKVEKDIIDTIGQLKGFDIEYYYFLTNLLQPAIRNLSDLVQSIILSKPPENVLYNHKILIEILNDELAKLKDLIIKGAGYLPKQQEQDTIQIILEHFDSLGKAEVKEVPGYLLKGLEVILKTSVTSEMFYKYSQNKGIILFYYKLFKIQGIKNFAAKNSDNLVTLITYFLQNQLQIIQKLITKVYFFEEVLKFNFTPAEEKEGFQKNRELFEIFIAIAKVRGLPLTYKMKKNFVSIYTGKKSINKFLPYIKRKAPGYAQYLLYLNRKKKQMAEQEIK